MNRQQQPITLEGLCAEKKMLPSLAYGWKSCSLKHKAAPQDKYLNHWQPANDTWAKGEKVVKLLGYDAGEQRRVARAESKDDPKYELRYLLCEWGWRREECVEAIQGAGLPLPGKSSCFFCPAMKKSEIVDLAAKHPDLFQRALAMEDNAQANLTSVKGLGRRFAWRSYAQDQGLLDETGAVQKKVPLTVLQSDDDDLDAPCECYDDGCLLPNDEADKPTLLQGYVVRRWSRHLGKFLYGTGHLGCSRWSWDQADARPFASVDEAKDWLCGTKASVVPFGNLQQDGGK